VPAPPLHPHDLSPSALRPAAPWHDLAPSTLRPSPHAPAAELLLAASSSARGLLLADLHATSAAPAHPETRHETILPNGVPRRAAASRRAAKVGQGPVSLVSLAPVAGASVAARSHGGGGGGGDGGGGGGGGGGGDCRGGGGGGGGGGGDCGTP